MTNTTEHIAAVQVASLWNYRNHTELKLISQTHFKKGFAWPQVHDSIPCERPA